MKKSSKRKNNKPAFTMIELLLSLAIIAILTGASLSIARFSDTQKNLTLSANKLRALIRSAQNYALAIPVPNFGEHICGFGVYFSNATTAQLFYTKATPAQFESNAATACSTHLQADGVAANFLEAITLPVVSSKTGINNDIFFRAPYGQVYSNNAALAGATKVTYTLTGTGGGSTREVSINSVGKIE